MYQIEIRIVGGNLAASLSGLGLLSESQQKQAVEASKNYMFTPEKQHLSVFINSGILFAVEHDNKKNRGGYNGTASRRFTQTRSYFYRKHQRRPIGKASQQGG